MKKEDFRAVYTYDSDHEGQTNFESAAGISYMAKSFLRIEVTDGGFEFAVFNKIWLPVRVLKLIPTLVSSEVEQEVYRYFLGTNWRLDSESVFRKRVYAADVPLHIEACRRVSRESRSIAFGLFLALFIDPEGDGQKLVELEENKWVRDHLPNHWDYYNKRIRRVNVQIINEVLKSDSIFK